MSLYVADQPLATRVLSGATSRDQMPQQFLFYGPPATGKRVAAVQLAYHLLGISPDDEGRAPLDLSIVRASGQQILLQELEDALSDLASRPVVAPCRVVIVEGAERLNNPTVGNRLLKPLEEPPPASRVILVTDRVEDLLPTLRSRCVPVPFRNPGWEAIARRAEARGMDATTARTLARAVGTRALSADPFFLAMHDIGVDVGLAILKGRQQAGATVRSAQTAMEEAALANPSDELTQLRRAADELEGKRGGKTAAKKAEDQEKRERRRAVTDGWEYVLTSAAGVIADALAIALGASTGPRHHHRADDIAALAAPAGFCIAALQEIERTRGDLRLNPTVDVAARALLARLDIIRSDGSLPPVAGRFPYL